MTLIPPELTVTVDNVGLVANTAEPEPVSSVNAVLKSEELKEPNDVVVLLDVIAPVKFGILVVDVAVPVSAPVKLPLKVVAVTTPATVSPLGIASGCLKLSPPTFVSAISFRG